jgi:hypothetical protein
MVSPSLAGKSDAGRSEISHGFGYSNRIATPKLTSVVSKSKFG